MITDDGKLDYKIVDKFANSLEKYGEKSYGQKKLIAEGVQLFDTTLYENASAYNDKPYAMLRTSAVRSLIRGNIRDEMKGADMFYRIPMYVRTTKIQSKRAQELALKAQNSKVVQNILKKKFK